MNTTIKNERPEVKRRYSFVIALLILLLIVFTSLLVISRFGKPEKMPQGVTDTTATNRIPPDSLHH
ncbi:MAG: hypothetical protein WDO19_14250 [Bacteroidota bacterium]